MPVRPVPEGYHTATPSLVVQGAKEVIEFVKQAFGGQERLRMDQPDGTVAHAEVAIGDSVVMVAEANEQWPAMPGWIHLYLEDCDGAYQRALQAGATSVQEPADQFYGDRSGIVRDPAGNMWSLATHIEDIPESEMEKRMQEWAGQS